MSRRVAITGATGFVGANLVRVLLREGHTVHALRRDDAPVWRLRDVAEAVAFHSVDVLDQGAVDRAMRRIQPEWVFHLAAYGAYPWQADEHRIITTNLIGTRNVVGAAVASGASVVVNTGSSSEYGAKAHAPTEDEVLEPNSTYAVSKAAATMMCRHLALTSGVPVPTLRLYSVYGPYEEPTRLIPTLILHAQRGAFPALTDPTTARDFVHVDDVANAYLRAAAAHHDDPGAVYNVGTGQQTPLATVVNLVERAFGLTVEPAWGTMPNRVWDTDVWVANVEKIRRALGWRAAYDIASGLQATIEWFDRNGLASEYEKRWNADAASARGA